MKDILIITLCLCIVFVFLCLTILRQLGYVQSVDLADFANISTALSPYITIISIYLAYLTLSDQQKSNRSSNSNTSLNLIQTEVNSIKSHLDLAFFIKANSGSTPMYGSQAVKGFIETITIWPNTSENDILNRDNKIVIEFVNNILFQFEHIVDIINSLENNERNLNDNDIKKARETVYSLLEYYFLIFSKVFERVLLAIKVKTHDEINSNVVAARSFYFMIKKYCALLSTLENKNYISRSTGFEELNDFFSSRESLEDKINSLSLVNYKIKK